MQPSNALQQMLKAPRSILDPGDGKYIHYDRDRLYCSLSNSSAGSETRYLDAPTSAGLPCHLGCILCASGSVVVYVYDSAGNHSDTITFSAAGQWIGLFSVETSLGVFHWQVTDIYGCTSDLPTTGDFAGVVNNGTITNLVGTAATIAAASIPALNATNMTLASNVTALTGVFKSIDCSSAMSALSGTFKAIEASTSLTAPLGTINQIVATSKIEANSILATNLSVGTSVTANSILVGTGGLNCSAGKLIQGQQLAMTGGTAASSAQAITAQNAFLAFTASTNNFYALPTSANGLGVKVVNKVGSTAVLVAANATQSIQGATSFSVATSNAVGGAPGLICDGTNWFVSPQ